MEIKQKGCLLQANRVVGAVAILCAASLAFIFVVSIPIAIIRNEIDAIMVLEVTILGLALVGGFGWMGSYWFWQFPDIRISETGLTTQLMFFHDNFRWQEIKGIVETKGHIKAKAILVNRRGMFLNRLYGLLVAREWDQPVILVSLRAENIEKLEQEILRRVGEMPKQQFTGTRHASDPFHAADTPPANG